MLGLKGDKGWTGLPGIIGLSGPSVSDIIYPHLVAGENSIINFMRSGFC